MLATAYEVKTMELECTGAAIVRKDDRSWIAFRPTCSVKARQAALKMEKGKTYTVSIQLKRKKRSLDANAYFWTLCGKLSAVVGVPPAEIYRQYIRDIGGNYEIVPIREDAVGRWLANWNARGLGWICEDLGASRKTPGYHNMICYAGSSTYDTAQMSRLIDLLVQDCKEQEVETLPPDELERLVSLWQAR